jgi:hypothetical protein
VAAEARVGADHAAHAVIEGAADLARVEVAIFHADIELGRNRVASLGE